MLLKLITTAVTVAADILAVEVQPHPTEVRRANPIA
jgi:hypothetical protein